MQNSCHNEKIVKIMDITKDWMEMDVQLLRPISNSCFPSKFCNVIPMKNSGRSWKLIASQSTSSFSKFCNVILMKNSERSWKLIASQSTASFSKCSATKEAIQAGISSLLSSGNMPLTNNCRELAWCTCRSNRIYPASLSLVFNK